MEKIKNFCSTCNLETNQEILHEVIQENEYDSGFWYKYKYQIIKCLGCDNIYYRTIKSDSESYDYDEDGDCIYLNDVDIYPKCGRDFITKKEYKNIYLNNQTENTKKMYEETIDAYNYGLFLLCAGGLRGIIESICISENVGQGTKSDTKKDGTTYERKYYLKEKIDLLFEKKLLTKDNTDILKNLIYLGNDALHQMKSPHKEEIKKAILIIEHTLENLYGYGIKEIYKELEPIKNARLKNN